MEIITRAQAEALGLDRYYTGKPCKHGHLSQRRVTDGHCKECCMRKHEERKALDPLYGTWRMMRNRCYNEQAHRYSSYGGRGITVCDRWLHPIHGYHNFCKDMGPRPEGHTLDRIDNDGPYCPDNCRWADEVTQVRNKQHTKIKGEDIPIIFGLLAEGLNQAQISRIYGCVHQNISNIVARYGGAARIT